MFSWWARVGFVLRECTVTFGKALQLFLLIKKKKTKAAPQPDGWKVWVIVFLF